MFNFIQYESFAPVYADIHTESVFTASGTFFDGAVETFSIRSSYESAQDTFSSSSSYSSGSTLQHFGGGITVVTSSGSDSGEWGSGEAYLLVTTSDTVSVDFQYLTVQPATVSYDVPTLLTITASTANPSTYTVTGLSYSTLLFGVDTTVGGTDTTNSTFLTTAETYTTWAGLYYLQNIVFLDDWTEDEYLLLSASPDIAPATDLMVRISFDTTIKAKDYTISSQFSAFAVDSSQSENPPPITVTVPVAFASLVSTIVIPGDATVRQDYFATGSGMTRSEASTEIFLGRTSGATQLSGGPAAFYDPHVYAALTGSEVVTTGTTIIPDFDNVVIANGQLQYARITTTQELVLSYSVTTLITIENPFISFNTSSAQGSFISIVAAVPRLYNPFPVFYGNIGVDSPYGFLDFANQRTNSAQVYRHLEVSFSTATGNHLAASEFNRLSFETLGVLADEGQNLVYAYRGQANLFAVPTYTDTFPLQVYSRLTVSADTTVNDTLFTTTTVTVVGVVATATATFVRFSSESAVTGAQARVGVTFTVSDETTTEPSLNSLSLGTTSTMFTEHGTIIVQLQSGLSPNVIPQWHSIIGTITPGGLSGVTRVLFGGNPAATSMDDICIHGGVQLSRIRLRESDSSVETLSDTAFVVESMGSVEGICIDRVYGLFGAAIDGNVGDILFGGIAVARYYPSFPDRLI